MRFSFLHRVAVFGFLFCAFSTGVIFAETSQAVLDRRAQLEKDLTDLEKQIDDQRTIVKVKEGESVSLQQNIDILNAQIKRAELSIKARALTIEKLSDTIDDKVGVINELDAKTEREQASLAELLRQTNALDRYSLPEVLLGGKKFSTFFADVGPFVSLKGQLQKSFETIRTDRDKTATEKQALEDRKTEEVQLQTLQKLEKRRQEQDQDEKKRILTVTKGVESLYKKLIASNEQNAAKIRAELFTLRGSNAIPFEKAVSYAINAGKVTGVRPALILGIIAEESNLGENVGTGNWRVDMKAPRDTEPFIKITQALGLDPDKVPVSKKPWYGYGGAMGPAQFIPSTWILYQDRIAKLTGHNPPNPWDPADAFTASAMLLADSGAKKQTYEAERGAALCYLAGCTNAKKKAYAFYGDDVMDLATKYQQQMRILGL